MLRTWNLEIEVTEDASKPIYINLADKIVEEIKRGRLKPETIMPSTRKLADHMQLNRKTVLLTYGELIAQGWLVTEKRRGTFVSKQLPADAFLHAEANPRQANGHHEPLQTLAGNVDGRLIPFETISRAFRKSLINASRSNQLGSQSACGRIDLRQAICNRLNIERGFNIGIDDVCMLRGSQMGLFIIAKMLVKADDVVVFDKLSRASARETFENHGASIAEVDCDDEGIDVQALRRVCESRQVRCVYVTPQNHFPTTVKLSSNRRRELLKLAERFDFYIIEDDRDYSFEFSKPVFPLASEFENDRILYIGSLSRIISPSLRVGYLIAKPSIIKQCAIEVARIDGHGNNVIEAAVADLLSGGEFQRYFMKMTKLYKQRRDDVAEYLDQELGNLVFFARPHNGLHFWLTLLKPVDLEEVDIGALGQLQHIQSNLDFEKTPLLLHGFRVDYSLRDSQRLYEEIKALKAYLLKLCR